MGVGNATQRAIAEVPEGGNRAGPALLLAAWGGAPESKSEGGSRN